MRRLRDRGGQAGAGARRQDARGRGAPRRDRQEGRPGELPLPQPRVLGAGGQEGAVGEVAAHKAKRGRRGEAPGLCAGAGVGHWRAGMSTQVENAGPEKATAVKAITIPKSITVRELSTLLEVSAIEVIKVLMKRGIMAAINQSVEDEPASAVATELGFQVQPEAAAEVSAEKREEEEGEENLQPRPPVVTVMGHVDHGKTSPLDAIRETKVTEKEVGAITQHIGAYQVEVNGQKITFIDTPGHEAFTAMRARGATVTDIPVLVVAADDGVMPQTLEAIDHAKAAGVPIIVAINKIDLPDANAERVKQQLAERELLIEEWGGDVIAIPVSAKTGDGLKHLLEHSLLVAEVSELKANPDRPAEGTIIESELDPSRGPMSTTIVRTGTLRVGDSVVAGDTWGRVKAMFGERGHRLKAVGPSSPAKIMGLSDVPRAGDTLIVVADERAAREVMDVRERERGAAARGAPPG